MQERPIGHLVNALNRLGANIKYLGKEGYPPLKISSPNPKWEDKISIDASVSSQFISALMLIAPYLTNGLEISMTGKKVSLPYIQMTAKIMETCGVKVTWTDNVIHINPGQYDCSTYLIESDWSAASYYYAIAGFSNFSNIKLKGLFQESLQADRIIADIGQKFGITTTYESDGIRIVKEKTNIPEFFEYDFLPCPDIAQTVMVMVAGHGISGLYSGLDTLKIKETDRFQAMKNELGKLGVSLVSLPTKFAKESNIKYYISEGEAEIVDVPIFETYNDHRVAMSLASLSVLFDIKIKNPEVVNKSYPNFWNDLKQLGISS